MFQNWSVTYLAAITTFAPLIVIVLGHFGISILESDIVTYVGSIVSAIGFIWQLINRFKKGDITPIGKKI